jgi:hypothetical protein
MFDFVFHVILIKTDIYFLNFGFFELWEIESDLHIHVALLDT